MNPPVSKGARSQAGVLSQEGKDPRQGGAGPFQQPLRWAMVWRHPGRVLRRVLVAVDDGRPARGRAILFDIVDEKFYLFDLVLWPQDALLLAVVLILAATALFFTTAIAGRLFCGFACPQTVYTSIFIVDRGQDRGRPPRAPAPRPGPDVGAQAAHQVGQARHWALVARGPRSASSAASLPIRNCCRQSSASRPGLGNLLAALLRDLHLSAGRARTRGRMPAHVVVLALPGRDDRSDTADVATDVKRGPMGLAAGGDKGRLHRLRNLRAGGVRRASTFHATDCNTSASQLRVVRRRVCDEVMDRIGAPH